MAAAGRGRAGRGRRGALSAPPAAAAPRGQTQPLKWRPEGSAGAARGAGARGAGRAGGARTREGPPARAIPRRAPSGRPRPARAPVVAQGPPWPGRRDGPGLRGERGTLRHRSERPCQGPRVPCETNPVPRPSASCRARGRCSGRPDTGQPVAWAVTGGPGRVSPACGKGRLPADAACRSRSPRKPGALRLHAATAQTAPNYASIDNKYSWQSMKVKLSFRDPETEFRLLADFSGRACAPCLHAITSPGEGCVRHTNPSRPVSFYPINLWGASDSACMAAGI